MKRNGMSFDVVIIGAGIALCRLDFFYSLDLFSRREGL